MNHEGRIAIIGSGATAIYLLKHLLDQLAPLRSQVREVSIFEKGEVMGMGMPYSPSNADRYNMSNISSEELPPLLMPFAQWLRAQSSSVLAELCLEGVEISDSEVYNRISLGRYLNAQYSELVDALRASGIEIREYPRCEIADVIDQLDDVAVTLLTKDGESHQFDKVVIATGHHWEEADRPAGGFFASPWPIYKLLPRQGSYLNFPVGTLGASLSAFDVISSLAHRHGAFEISDDKSMTFLPFSGAENFSVTMHAANGLLPHLQFDQEEPYREIYRHVSRRNLLKLVDENGFLRIETYFDQVARPALKKAFARDQMPEMVELLDSHEFQLKDFIERMTSQHDYADAFEGMRSEMVAARASVEERKPIHWKEVVDDLMYTLNFHAELMPAEDHLVLKAVVMPFLMNVIAAMPLPSAQMLLALHDAGRLALVSGKVEIPEIQATEGMTTVVVKDEGEESAYTYRMFVDCSGQKPLEIEEYPFGTLVRNGDVRKARARFLDPDGIDAISEEQKDHVFHDEGTWAYHTGGIDITAGYRLVNKDGKSNPRIFDLAFPHTSGVRPYSYGLQACSHTAAILVASWVGEIHAGGSSVQQTVDATKLFEQVNELGDAPST